MQGGSALRLLPAKCVRIRPPPDNNVADRVWLRRLVGCAGDEVVAGGRRLSIWSICVARCRAWLAVGPLGQRPAGRCVSQAHVVRRVDRYLRRTGGERRDLLHERAGAGHPEVCPQRFGIGPVLKEHQPERIFAITVNRVRKASGFLPGAAHVSQAERENLVDGVRPGLNPGRDDKHR